MHPALCGGCPMLPANLTLKFLSHCHLFSIDSIIHDLLILIELHVNVLSLQVIWVFPVSHLTRSPLCSKDYEAQLNPRCQQVVVPFMLLSTTVSPVADDGRQLEADFMHAIGGSLNVNELLALSSEYVSGDILNKDDAEEDYFPISLMMMLMMEVLLPTSKGGNTNFENNY